MNPFVEAFKTEVREFCSSLYLGQIEDIFERAGFERDKSIDKSSFSRRDLVEEYYKSKIWEEHSIEALEAFLKVVEEILHIYSLSDKEKEYIRKKAIDLGFDIDERGDLISYKGINCRKSLFLTQFPVGLPFGKPKPNFLVKAEGGAQELKFSLQSGNAILDAEDVYPNLNFRKLAGYFDCDIENETFKRAITSMNQTGCERKLFLKYAKKFEMPYRDIPVLIPQAWIQWNSKTRKELISNSDFDFNQIYRVDFVAFWKSKRFVVFLDDIGHYGKKHNDLWLADEESYFKGLVEERTLRQQGWEVFRISNFEVKQDLKLDDLLENMRFFLDF
jgi:very-short-patch-repair endonuclease